MLQHVQALVVLLGLSSFGSAGLDSARCCPGLLARMNSKAALIKAICEVGPAQPVDRAMAVNQRGRFAVADHRVFLDTNRHANSGHGLQVAY